MGHVINGKNIIYTGADIVDSLVADLTLSNSNDNVRFIIRDIIRDRPIDADLWICRDVLFHFPLNEISIVINKFKESRCKYFMTNHFSEISENTDIKFGEFRLINLCKEPFFLEEPIELLADDAYGPGHHIGVWVNRLV